MKLRQLLMNETSERGFQELASAIIMYLRGGAVKRSELNSLINDSLLKYGMQRGEVHLTTDVIMDWLSQQGLEFVAQKDPENLGQEIYHLITGLSSAGTLLTYRLADDETKAQLLRHASGMPRSADAASA